jgi:hypothetical protein
MPRQRPTAASVPRDRAFWLAAMVLVTGQLVAFWMLCSHQVRMAEVRHASARVEAIAIADCLRFVPNSTMVSCAARVAPLDNQTVATTDKSAQSAPTPVNYVYR